MTDQKRCAHERDGRRCRRRPTHGRYCQRHAPPGDDCETCAYVATLRHCHVCDKILPSSEYCSHIKAAMRGGA